MANVTHESLAARIAELESGQRSLKEEFALEAYRMLLAAIARTEVIVNWDGAEYYSSAVELCKSDGVEFALAISELATALGVENNG
ncbi:hypothetical protein E0D81_12605 [Lelliottia amnigena]|uniref:hypothetical protein n=1 Tax=Lelliottia amnigena TaxID=61646 RepID=UPI00103FC9F4|nr:hypothetical protein [Lelliottia amnigena]MCG7781023.1 hypothetical protein [Lelliottia amnigena]TCD18157.1 hypothetical protein E0D81_12605 [Lelliottia amnigena]